jgi:hypothetical protein
MDNPNQKAMDGLLNDIAETLKMIETHEGPIKPIPNEEVVLGQVEMVKDIVVMVNEFLAKFQPPEGTEIDLSQMSSNKKQFLLKAKDVEKEAKILDKAFSSALKKSKKEKKSAKGKKGGGQGQQVKERKKLFKSIGGDKKWIPL